MEPTRSGVVVMHEPAFAYVTFGDLDAFTQGYVEALFFTEADGEIAALNFDDLAPATLATIVADCRDFCERSAWLRAINAAPYYNFPGETQGGHDFWLTRNGHGAGFWDGDWPEPYAAALDEAARAAGSLDAYRGDDGLIYFAQ